MSELVTGAQNSVLFWEEKGLTRRRSAQPFPDSNYNVSSLSWSSNNSKLAVVPKWGDRVAICEFRDDILTWSHLTQKDSGTFTCGCLLSNSRYLVSGCGNSSVLVWDLKHRNIIKTFQEHSGAVTSVTATANDHLVVSGGQDGQIFIHPLSSSSKMKTVNLTRDQTTAKAVSRLYVSLMEQSHLGCVCEGGEVSLWSIDSQRKLTTFSTKHSGAATDLSFTPSNKILMVSVGLDAYIRCYDLQSRKVVATIAAPGPLSAVSILRDGSTLLAGGTDGQLYLYELRSLKTPKSVIEAHQSAVSCITPQVALKIPAKKSSAKGSQVKGQLSPDASLLQSADKSSPKGQRSRPDAPRPHPQVPPPKEIHMLPETVTPFVTQRAPLEVATPYSIGKQPGEEWMRRGIPLAAAMVTPAHSEHGNMSSIFSPLDTQHMATPLTSGGKVTAAVPPTTRQGVTITTPSAAEISTLPDQGGTSAQSGLVSSTPATTVQAPPPSVPLVTPLIQTNRSAHFSTTNLGAGIFSPLDSSRHGDLQIGQSPLLKANTPMMSHDSHVTTVSEDTRNVQASHDSHVTSNDTVSKPQVTPLSKQSSVHVPVTTDLSITPHGESHRSTETLSTSLHNTSTERGNSPIAPPPPGSAVQTQYLERVIKDSSEELWYSVHRDTRGLTVDMIKQFLTLQEGLAHQFAALNEKVDRLSEENRRLQELVHRYMPKH